MTPISRELLDKYIQGQCTPAEESRIVHWLDENDIEDYPGVHSDKKYDRKEKTGWQRLVNRFDELRPVREKKKFFGRKWIWAAAAAIAALTALSVYMQHNGFLLTPYATEYQTSYGEVKRVTLADGTTVTLNAESVLKIRKGFGGKNRTVYLDGEAFFEVKHQADEPFIVKTRELAVAVLGTAFNVSAFSNDRQQKVSLKKGKVQVRIPLKNGTKGIMLAPGEEMRLVKKNQAIKISEMNVKEVTSWQKQVIFFENAGMEEVVHKLERFYGVNIDVQQLPSRHWQLTGEYKNATLKEVLESLSFNYNLKYKMKEDEVVLYDE